MDETRLKIWETLFGRALEIIDSGRLYGTALDDWRFGGETVLMRKYRHRFSKDIDIFIPDPEYLGYLTPWLNDVAQSQATDYIEQANTLKVYYQEGEIDFIVSSVLTPAPFTNEIIMRRPVQVETPTEILAKKIWHRGSDFRARDIFDLAFMIENEPKLLSGLGDIVSKRREVILERIQKNKDQLQEDFMAIDTLDYNPTFDKSVTAICDFLNQFSKDAR